MKRSARLEQSDIEIAIGKALKECGEKMVPGSGSWKLLKADNKGEHDSIAFVCDIEKIPIEETPQND